ncbi:MAG: type II secretion system minor pseudopilin GspJ [Gammaproteobacteria bacterium]|nr:type II secretion system minor pseudopilin GspJ [Gammaproteobacteria bacterium]MCY4283101.1 type II secretion system minor pseudopilin GspJ [Gammaproteobacteria bacterium]MCY4339007.1 type II secretion system minor pseudopilin GspJ [Gammaproteobacteria bacterium]
MIASVSRHSGMTLLELIVAIAIFSLVAAAAYGALSQGLVVQERLAQQRHFWQRFDTVFNLIHTDLEQAVALAPRHAAGHSFDGRHYGASSAYGHLLEFTRAVNTTYQGGAASPFQRVAYQLDDGRLYRRVQARLDQPYGIEGTPSLLLEGISDMRLRYLAGTGMWGPRWPQPPQAEALPRVVELTLELEARGAFRWLFHVGPAR